MIKFVSTIFEHILVEGAATLKAERNFKIFKNFDLNITKDEKPLLSISTKTNLYKTTFSPVNNNTGYKIEIENNSKIRFDGEVFELKVDKLYPFKKKYAEVHIGDKKKGELLFEKKWLNTVLTFHPALDYYLDQELAIKISILILLNIADLDGSE